MNNLGCEETQLELTPVKTSKIDWPQAVRYLIFFSMVWKLWLFHYNKMLAINTRCTANRNIFGKWQEQFCTKRSRTNTKISFKIVNSTISNLLLPLFTVLVRTSSCRTKHWTKTSLYWKGKPYCKLLDWVFKFDSQ